MCFFGEEYVVPDMRAGGFGWWIGQVLGKTGRFHEVNLLWVECPEKAPPEMTIFTLDEKVVGQESIMDAINYLQDRGVPFLMGV